MIAADQKALLCIAVAYIGPVCLQKRLRSSSANDFFSFTASHPTAQIRWAVFQKMQFARLQVGSDEDLVISHMPCTSYFFVISINRWEKTLAGDIKKWLLSLNRLDSQRRNFKSLQRFLLFNTAFNHSCRLDAGVELTV